MIKFTVKGDWSKTERFLERALNIVKLGTLDKYGQRGVDALKEATPKDTGRTADSWYYRIVHTYEGARIEWLNSSSNDGVLIAILLQYGHAFQNGEFFEGLDYINPAIKPIFEEIAEDAWRELQNE